MEELMNVLGRAANMQQQQQRGGLFVLPLFLIYSSFLTISAQASSSVYWTSLALVETVADDCVFAF